MVEGRAFDLQVCEVRALRISQGADQSMLARASCADADVAIALGAALCISERPAGCLITSGGGVLAERWLKMAIMH